MHMKTGRAPLYVCAKLHVWIVFVLLAGLLLAGCQPQTSVAVPTPNMEPTPTVVAETTESSPSPTATPDAATPEPTPTDTPTATAAVSAGKLSDILNVVTKLPNGSAGISLKQASAAAKVLDWAESTDLSEEGIAEKISAYLDGLSDPAAVGTFTVNFTLIADIPQKIIDGEDGTLGMVSEAGYTLLHASYTQAKWDAFLEAFEDCLPSMYSSYADMVSFDPETGWALFDYWDMLKGDEAAQWLVEHDGYTEANAQEYVENMSESEYIKKNTNTRVRAVDMRTAPIKMMYHADGTQVDDAVTVSLTYNEFSNLYQTNPDAVLKTYFYFVTIKSGTVKLVEQLYWP